MENMMWLSAAILLLCSDQGDGFTLPSRRALRPGSNVCARHQSQSQSIALHSTLQEDPKLEKTNGETIIENGSVVASPRPDTEEGVFSWTKQWYPVMPETYLQDQKPMPLTVLGQNLVIWKTVDGKVSVLDDSCPHRRAPLSTGKIVGDRLACRYHGWEFDASGGCKKIPMDSSDDDKLASKFCTKSYHAQVKGGLLWVFMDPETANPPPITGELVDEKHSVEGWNLYISPVSFMSQIENSFDPTHAPFTHDGSNSPGGGRYSPENALAMERYDLTAPMTKKGFSLEHSPYQRLPPGAPEIATTRQFLPPCTSVVKTPFFTANLHFVPSKPGEALVVVNFGRGNKKKGLLQKLLPRRLMVAMKDYVHFRSWISDGQKQFLMQDQLTMQGQDSRKANDKRWADMTPTPSDAGVKAFQRWMGRYGSFGPFPVEELDGHMGMDKSMWDSHGKYCPQCQASIRRLARVERAMDKVGMASLSASLFGSLLWSLLVATHKIRRASVDFLAPTVSLIALSVGARALSQFCSKLIARAFVTRETDARLGTMEIYPE